AGVTMRSTSAASPGRGDVMRRSTISQAIFTAVLVFGSAWPAVACPNCKEAVAAQPSELAPMSNGYNYSVLFMLGMPFTLLGMGAFMVTRAVKRGTLPEF